MREYPALKNQNQLPWPTPASTPLSLAPIYSNMLKRVYFYCSVFFPPILSWTCSRFLYPHHTTETALPEFIRDFHNSQFKGISVFFLLDLLAVFNVVSPPLPFLKRFSLGLWDTLRTSPVTGCSCPACLLYLSTVTGTRTYFQDPFSLLYLLLLPCWSHPIL